ncbi:tripartite ATP-independent transporter DctP family solute receptor [Ureibacillus xyleni]|uniref:Tripartite ATP-independent transporter DctP family solute receptor n=1 Tax=Ureibacillus xyleni TaxID=614648 RepID=A0A285TQ85_9BACL|nr:TRAP transporter substrate-binding protein [Ureibacillus xyleni]SOC25274.1 tripartite ATP-independent transporter DctP family solute receptor [Ureibacillus xyleni]
MKKNLKKIVFSLMALSLIFLAACSSDNSGEADATGGSGSSGDKLTIKMANQVDANNFLNLGYEHFKKTIEEKTDNVAVEIYNGGTLATSDESVVDLLKNGTIQLSTSSAYGIANSLDIKAFNLFDVPFLFDSRDQYYEFLNGEYGDLLKKEVSEKSNLYLLGFIDLGYYSLLNGKKAVEEPSDLSGLKIRSSSADLHLSALKAMQANPTPMAYSEVFTGLQQGTIDGVSTTTPLIYGDRFYEVNKYFTATNHVLLLHGILVDKKLYDGLDEATKTALDESIASYVEEAKKLVTDAESKAIQGFKDAGVEVVELSEEQREIFKEATNKVAEENMDAIGQENYDLAIKLLSEMK